MTGVSVVVVTFNDVANLPDCLAAVVGKPGVGEVILVDNASTDGSAEMVRTRFPTVRVVENAENVGHPRACNQGAALASGDVIFFLDSDTVPEPGCVDAVAAALRISPGAAAPTIRTMANSRVEYGLTVDLMGFPIGLQAAGQPLFAQGCALATSRYVWEALGGYDDRFFFTPDDLDYCWRVLLTGGEVQAVPGARLTHLGGASTPGGYSAGGRHRTTGLRLVERDRCTLACLIKCASPGWLSWLVPAYVAQTLATSLVVALMGRPRIAGRLIAGLVWNVRQLPDTLARRRRTKRLPGASRRAQARVQRRFSMVQLLRREGLPTFAEGATRP
jgi:GT2 family glycosyltransferase